MFGFAIAIITALLLLFCYSCSTNNDIDKISPDNLAYAYLEVFKAMVGDMREPYFLVFNRIKYVGVDTTNILYENLSDIKILLEDYANKNRVSLIWDKKKNECDSDFFSKGWLIIFYDIEFTETKLQTVVTWMGAVALASENLTYIVEREAGEWTITDWQWNWVS